MFSVKLGILNIHMYYCDFWPCTDYSKKLFAINVYRNLFHFSVGPCIGQCQPSFDSHQFGIQFSNLLEFLLWQTQTKLQNAKTKSTFERINKAEVCQGGYGRRWKLQLRSNPGNNYKGCQLKLIIPGHFFHTPFLSFPK